MDCSQSGDVHLGDRPREGPRLLSPHSRAGAVIQTCTPHSPENLGGGPEASPCPVSGLAQASRDPSPLQDQVSKDKALQSMASMSSAQIVSASVLQNKFSPPSPLPQAVFSTSSRV